MKRIILITLCVLCGCCRNTLYVQQEWVDARFLASSHVGTPDPRQKCPPKGQRLLIQWNFPRNLAQRDLHLEITVRLWDHTETTEIYPITKRSGSTAFFYPNIKILTYRVLAVDETGEIVDTWEHHFWTNLIEIH
jgi:hypothetical protein